MSKQITITYLGVDGKGATLTAAKNDAGRKIEMMLKGDYTPRLIQYRQFTMVLFRDPFRGWVCSSIENVESNNADGSALTKPLWSSSASGDDYETAYNSALFHLAQLTWQPEDGIRPPDFLNVALQNECREYFRWQTGYRVLQAEGMEDTAIRARLLHNGRDLDLPICHKCERKAFTKTNGAWECASCTLPSQRNHEQNTARSLETGLNYYLPADREVSIAVDEFTVRLFRERGHVWVEIWPADENEDLVSCCTTDIDRKLDIPTTTRRKEP